MDQKERMELYKQQYFFEHGRKEQLNSLVSIPIGLVIVFFGVFVYFINQFPEVIPGTNTLVFSIVMLLYIITFISTCYFIIRIYLKYKYLCLPDSENIDKYFQVLTEHYDKYVENYRGNEIELEAFLKDNFEVCFLNKGIIEANVQNTSNNNKKAKFLFLTYAFILILSILSVIAFFTAHANDIEPTLNEIKTQVFVREVI